jgi:hypothetical protein
MGVLGRLIEEQSHERAWLVAYAAMHADRNPHIRRAAELGISISEIARLVDLSRTHVSLIVHAEE